MHNVNTLTTQLLTVLHILLTRMREGRRIGTNSICLAKQNDPEQNFSLNFSATKVKYEQRGLMTENIKCKMLKVQ